ncbi:MAG: response regulator [Spirochaetales bacterium]|nr:response regulator [Spirochaetales bacterium]
MKNPVTLVSFILLFLLFLIHGAAGNTDPIVLSSDLTSKKITQNVSFINDPLNTFTFDSIRAHENEQWSAPKTDNIICTVNTWFTFSVLNNTDDVVYLVIHNTKVNKIDFYYDDQDSGQWKIIHTGSEMPLTSRPIISPFFAFELKKSSLPIRYYLHTKMNISFALDVRIYNQHEFRHYNFLNLFLHSIFFGMLLFAIFYNTFLFITTKEKQFIALVLYVTGWLGLNLYLNGYGVIFIWEHVLWMEIYGIFIFTALVGIGNVFFLRHYLHLKKDYPVFDKILFYVFLPFSCLTLISIFLLPISFLYTLESIRGGSQTLVTLFIAIYIAVKKNKNAYFFLFAYFIIPFFNIILVLIASGVISTGIFSRWGGTVSTSWLVICLSFGVGYSYHMMQKKTRDTEVRYQLLNDSIMEGLFITDVNGKILETNKAFQTMMEYTPEQFSKLQTTDFTPSHWHETDKSIMESQVIKHGYSDVYEIEYKTSTGNILRVEIRKYLIKNKNKIEGIWAIVRDITEKFRLRKQLIQSQKMDTVGQLAGGIAHDLNNMLGGILGFAEILQESIHKEKPERNQVYIDNIINITKKAAELNTQLLTFSRKADLIKINFDIHNAIDEVILILERTIDKKIRIRKDFTAEKHIIYGDVIHIQNALLNLGINARDVMPDGGSISFMTRNLFIDEELKKGFGFPMNPGMYIEISISDTGTGIDEQIKDKIFEPFFTTKELGKGTGLGLSAVYGTVKEHNGALTFNSQQGIGTTFNIYLQTHEGSITSHDRKPADVTKGSGTILVGEDDKALQLVFNTLLHQFGYDTIIRKNGKETFDYYKAYHKEIDLVIMDIIMPEFNGMEVYEKMKKINPNVKVILCSGYSCGINISELLKSGVKYFLKKPFSGKNLSQIIYNSLRKKPIKEKNILFVDDEEVILNTTTDFLTTMGHHIYGFSNPYEALEQFKLKSPIFDIAIIDNFIPQMNGLELSTQLLLIRPDLPIILTTGEPGEELKKETQRIGIKYIMTKPYSITDLLHIMK